MNSTSPEISIIVPIYKVEQYLDRCVESILKQTFTDFELILVDDGSPDNCPKMCDEWSKKDSRIKVIHKKNGGLSSARNAGLDVARGKYIGFVDSDDYISEDMYSHLYQLLIKNQADISICAFTRNPKKLGEHTKEKTTILQGNAIKDYFYRINGESSNYSVCNRLYTTDLLQHVRFRLDFINEDVLFSYEIYKYTARIVISNQKKYLYFQNENGITRKKLSINDLSLFKVWDEIVKDEKNPEYSYYAELNRKRATFTLYVKGKLYGRDASIPTSVFKEWNRELKNNYKELMNGHFLNGSRKFVCFVICKIL